MKIIYVENVRIPSERAHAYQIVQTCAWMARAGHDVTLVNPDRASGQGVFSYFNLPKDLFHHVVLRSWDPLSVGFSLKTLGYAMQRWAFTRALRRWAHGAQADVWYTRDVAMIDALKDIVSGPWVLESHDTPDANTERWLRVKDRITGSIAISKGVRDRLVALGVPEDRMCLAPDAYAPEAFASLPSREEARHRLGISDDAFVVIYAGSLYSWKGVDLVVRAWEKAPAQATFVIIGGPEEDRRRLEARVPSVVASRVKFLGPVPRTEALSFLPAGDVGLLSTSSGDPLGNIYTSPLKQFEYLAAGLPVLASDVPSSHDVLTSDVARFYAPTEEGFASALKELMQDESWQQHARANARPLVAPYTWEARTRSIVEWIDHVTTKTP